MPNYFFLIGRTPELSLSELKSLTGQSPVQVFPNIVQMPFSSDDEAKKIFRSLGGSLKIMKHVGEFSLVDQKTLINYIGAYLAQSNRPTFAIAEFGKQNQEKIDPSDIKKDLRDRGIGSRFIEGGADGLSASVLLHHKVAEINIFYQKDSIILAETLAVQDIDDWTKRDRAKPFANRKKGLLPPKVARMMVNLAVGQSAKQMIYDPFCGSGTVLMEGLMRGCKVVGSDLDAEAITGAQQNLTWFCHEYEHSMDDVNIFASDVTNVDPSRFPEKVDAIVTEPFLGKQTPSPTQLGNIFKGLEKLYLGAFKQWTKILKPGSRVVIIFPYVHVGKDAYSLENLVDKLSAFGYTSTSQPIFYSRPQASVERQIWQFTFQNSAKK